MPHLVLTARASEGVNRCRRFLAAKSPLAARRAFDTIIRHIDALAISPDIGRPYDADADLRELVIPFGDAGYLALYRHDSTLDRVYVLAICHQREEGY